MTLNTSATSEYADLFLDSAASTKVTISSNVLTRSEVANIVNEVIDKKTPEVRPDTVTKLDVKHGKIYVKHYKDGFFKNERYLIPDITDVKVHGNTVIVTFAVPALILFS